jgi:hypothetical protein
MGERLKFGRPDSPAQALLRLPTRQHPDYLSSGGPIEHLVHLNEHLGVVSVERDGLPLIERNVPLNIDDMRLLEKFSFRRRRDELLTIQWESIRRGSEWSLIFPQGYDSYRWWQVARMQPDLDLPGLIFVSVELNSRFCSQPTEWRSDENSEFELFLLTPEELMGLKAELTRNNR